MIDEKKTGLSKVKYNVIEFHDAIFVYNLFVPYKYRGKHLPSKIFDSIVRKYNKVIMLECDDSLLEYYIGLGFKIVEDKDKKGRYLMELNKQKKENSKKESMKVRQAKKFPAISR